MESYFQIEIVIGEFFIRVEVCRLHSDDDEHIDSEALWEFDLKKKDPKAALASARALASNVARVLMCDVRENHL